MIAEGVGRKAPQKVRIDMTEAELCTVFHAAKERAEHRGYKARADQWGQGIKGGVDLPGIGTLTQATRPIYSGLLGEYAMMRYVMARFPYGHQCKVDTRLLKGGDFGIDLVAYGLKMQVKTRQKQDNKTLFKRANRHGFVYSIPAHACVFCEWNGGSSIYLVGWQWSSFIKSLTLVAAPYGDWFNAEVADDDLLPMCQMRDELQAWRLRD